MYLAYVLETNVKTHLLPQLVDREERIREEWHAPDVRNHNLSHRALRVVGPDRHDADTGRCCVVGAVGCCDFVVAGADLELDEVLAARVRVPSAAAVNDSLKGR